MKVSDQRHVQAVCTGK